LSYGWQRDRQIADNLVEALGYHMKKIEDESKMRTNKHFVVEQVWRQRETTPQPGRLLLLYMDDTVADVTPFGDVRQRAYKIMPKGCAADRRPAPECKAGEQIGPALADGKQTRRHAERDHLLQLRHPVTVVHQERGDW
jgi:hypothetical protein